MSHFELSIQVVGKGKIQRALLVRCICFKPQTGNIMTNEGEFSPCTTHWRRERLSREPFESPVTD